MCTRARSRARGLIWWSWPENRLFRETPVAGGRWGNALLRPRETVPPLAIVVSAGAERGGRPQPDTHCVLAPRARSPRRPRAAKCRAIHPRTTAHSSGQPRSLARTCCRTLSRAHAHRGREQSAAARRSPPRDRAPLAAQQAPPRRPRPRRPLRARTTRPGASRAKASIYTFHDRARAPKQPAAVAPSPLARAPIHTAPATAGARYRTWPTSPEGSCLHARAQRIERGAHRGAQQQPAAVAPSPLTRALQRVLHSDPSKGRCVSIARTPSAQRSAPLRPFERSLWVHFVKSQTLSSCYLTGHSKGRCGRAVVATSGIARRWTPPATRQC